MTPEELQAIRERADKATPGPWGCHSRNGANPDSAPREATGIDYYLGWEIDGPPDADRGQFSRGFDADFIAHARKDVPELLAEVKRLQAHIAARERDPFDDVAPEHIQVTQAGATHWSSGPGNLTFDNQCPRCWFDQAKRLEAELAEARGLKAGRAERERADAPPA